MMAHFRGAPPPVGRSSYHSGRDETMDARKMMLVALLGGVLAAPLAAQQNVSAPAQDRRPGLAVFPFTNGGSFGKDKEDLAPLEVGIQQMLLMQSHSTFPAGVCTWSSAKATRCPASSSIGTATWW